MQTHQLSVKLIDYYGRMVLSWPAIKLREIDREREREIDR